MSDSPDAHLQLKKRARRRLVGAIAFAGLAAVILPMVMDDEPKQQVQDVQIRIPGQDQVAFNPKVVKPGPAAESGVKAESQEMAEPARSSPPPAAESNPVEAGAGKTTERAAEKAPEKPAEKKSEKKAEKSADAVSAKPVEKPAKAAESDPRRAAAILGGKSAEAAPTATAGNGSGQYVVLIGAFSNQANVKLLQSKIGELGIKVYTETLESPDGKKTRVRAGPFPSRDAADKALDKMKRIGVNGVVAAKS